jgi:hypothetical protein
MPLVTFSDRLRRRNQLWWDAGRRVLEVDSDVCLLYVETMPALKMNLAVR